MRRQLRLRMAVVGGVVLVGAGLWLARFNTADIELEPRYDVERYVRYGFTLHNPTNRPMDGVEFWTYAPVQLTSTQRCCERLEASVKHTLEIDEAGNQVMHFAVPVLAPYSSAVIQINAELRMANKENPVKVKGNRPYLEETRYVEYSDPRIQALAARMKGDGSGAFARTAFDLTRGSLRYAGYVRKDEGALHALVTGKGDCTEFMYLFMALARSKGVPARGVGGYVYDRDAVLKAADYHNWAEFYTDGAWHIADAQKGVFERENSNYIAMEILGPPKEGAVSNAHRFWYKGDGLEVRMN